MKSNLDKHISSINWELLREQKTILIEMAADYTNVTNPQRQALDGVLNLIDGLQEAVVNDNYFTEEEVCGPAVEEDPSLSEKFKELGKIMEPHLPAELTDPNIPSFDNPGMQSHFDKNHFPRNGDYIFNDIMERIGGYTLEFTDIGSRTDHMYYYDNPILAEKDWETFKAWLDDAALMHFCVIDKRNGMRIGATNTLKEAQRLVDDLSTLNDIRRWQVPDIFEIKEFPNPLLQTSKPQ